MFRNRKIFFNMLGGKKDLQKCVKDLENISKESLKKTLIERESDFLVVNIFNNKKTTNYISPSIQTSEKETTSQCEEEETAQEKVEQEETSLPIQTLQSEDSNRDAESLVDYKILKKKINKRNSDDCGGDEDRCHQPTLKSCLYRRVRKSLEK